MVARCRPLLGRLVFPTALVVAPGAEDAAASFWAAVAHHCRARRLGRLVVHSFEGRQGSPLPVLGPTRLTERTEYELDFEPKPDG
jgi:hypothetical protein